MTTLTYMVGDPWLICLRSSETATARLVCFPYAGGSPTVFARWGPLTPPCVELWAVHYPGRGSRFKERPYSHLAPLVQEIVPRLPFLVNKPFLFFGHSLGALIAYETSRMMERLDLLRPARLFVSSCPAPHLLPTGPPVHDLPAEELLDELRELGGVPEEILNNEEILRLMLPVIRADLALLETYQYSEKSALTVPITAFGGEQDPLANPGQLAAWKSHTAADFRQMMFPGNHFYIHENISAIVAEICRDD